MKMEKAKDATTLSRRDHLFRAQRFDAEDYGYAAENPVCTEGAGDSERYLSCLRTPDGAPFAWKRTGFVCLKTCHGIDNVIVDSYDLFTDQQYSAPCIFVLTVMVPTRHRRASLTRFSLKSPGNPPSPRQAPSGKI
jgi:hypothetical protein